MQDSPIEWCDSTWNPITGCSHESDGCRYCYAETVSTRFRRTVKPWTFNNIAENLAYHEERYLDPFRKRRPSVIFTCSMGDLFHQVADWTHLRVILGVMVAVARHRYLVLTKRPDVTYEFLRYNSPLACWKAAVARFPDAGLPVIGTSRNEDWRAIDWLWLGASTEDQKNYDLRISTLLNCRVAHRFISAEPLLGAIDLGGAGMLDDLGEPLLEWVIAGGESGGSESRSLVRRAVPHVGGLEPKPERLEWVRSLRDQCENYGVAFHFKQFGGRNHSEGGRILDGRTHDDNPARDSLIVAPSMFT